MSIEIAKEIINLLRLYNFKEHNDFLTTELKKYHPADIADAVTHLPIKYQKAIVNLLPIEIVSEIIVELDDSVIADLVEEISAKKIPRLIDEMEIDDAVNVISQLDDDKIEKIFSSLSKKTAEDVRSLMKYPEESAGRIMTRAFIAVNTEDKISDAINHIKKIVKQEEIERVDNIYVIDKKWHLLGKVSLQTVLLYDNNNRIGDYMKQVFSVNVLTDQEQVVRKAMKYDLLAVPVVDHNQVLMGIVTIDDIIDVLEEEIEEDISHMAGTGDEEIHDHSVFRVSRQRLPWLIIGLFGGIMAALIISRFETSLHELVAIAFFVPVITAMGGNIGIQSSSIVVRGLATGDIRIIDTWKRLFKEIRISLLNGIVCGLILGGIVFLWFQELYLGIVLGVSLLSVIFISAVISSMVPLILKRFNIDPALATGPFVTTTNDILGLFIYLGIASTYLQYFK